MKKYYPLILISTYKVISEWYDSNTRRPIPKTGTLPTEIHSDSIKYKT